MNSDARSPTIQDISDALSTMQGAVKKTPLIESHALNHLAGGRVLMKLESLQWTGSFKVRGAFSKIASFSEEQRRKGVVAYSSGNHAQGLAAVARRLGTSAVVLMPRDAAENKVQRTRAHGAEVVLYDRARDNKDALLSDMVAATGRHVVPPFDDPKVIAGQGTVGWELGEQMQAMGLKADAVLVPCGGGGLVAGVALALRHFQPKAAVFAVEPETVDDVRRSLKAGARLANAPGATSICDGLLSSVGELTFSMHREYVCGGIAVTDDDVRKAMLYAFQELKLVLEPSGAVGLAAVLNRTFDARGRTVALVFSGGNVEPHRLRELLR